MDTRLEPGAEYGSLPFDRFAVSQWNYSKPEAQDQEQWNALAKKWLDMTHAERHPIWEVWFPECTPPPGASYLPTQEQVARVLAPHQTIKERNITQMTANSCSHTPVWIRTCYAKDLQATWEIMRDSALSFSGGLQDDSLVLDDEALYSCHDKEWTKIFLRLPMLLDDDPFDDMLFTDWEGHDDPAFADLDAAARKEEHAIYLVDEQALRENLIKLMYLDTHGNIVWHHKIAPEHVAWYEAYYGPRGMLSTWVSEWCENDPALLTPGAQLEGEEL